jgi:hypothetical protein
MFFGKKYSINVRLEKMKNKIPWVCSLLKFATHAYGYISYYTIILGGGCNASFIRVIF